MDKIIYTIGTSNRSAENFIELLTEYHVLQLVDVRRFPTSKLEHFKREHLNEICHLNGIAYYWLGDSLGGFRSGGYEVFMQTEEFQQGLSTLEELAHRKPSAFCCAERFPWKCHRQFIARRLLKQGWHVIHIIDKKEIWQPKQMDIF